MDYDSLDASGRKAYRVAISGSHHRRVYYDLVRVDDTPVRSIDKPLSGVINGDDDRSPREVLEVDAFDDDHLLDWRLGAHRKFKILVIDARFVPELDDWVERVVFTGQLWDFDREGSVVSLVAQGSERLAMGSVRQVYSKPRKFKGSEVIRDLLTLAGAPKRGLVIPRLSKRLPKSVTVGVRRGPDQNPDKEGKQQRKVQRFRAGKADTYWGASRPVAEALDRDLFSDWLGRFVLATPKSAPSVTVTAKQLVGQVVERRGQDGEVVNTWEVHGRNPKGPKPQVHVTAALPKRHASSAQSLDWHGSPRKVIETIENKQLNKAEALALARRKRDRGERESVEYEIRLLPMIPWVRPGMLVTAPTDKGKVAVRASRWSVPLGPGPDPLVIGANRRRG
jgi:hypothetical protein